MIRLIMIVIQNLYINQLIVNFYKKFVNNIINSISLWKIYEWQNQIQIYMVNL